jgi:hypothetical protein
LLCSVAAAQRLAPQMSPIVTFDPYGPNNNPPSARPLTAAETKLARERAAALFDAMKATPVFREPGERVSLLASWAIVGPQRAVEQSFTPYWSAVNDARRRADGALVPVLGGAHRVFSFTTNYPPAASKLEDRATRGNFSRSAGSHGLTFDAIAMPRVLGELGGGTVYADMVVFTRDGRSVLEPAPLGPLLEAEVIRVRQYIADLDAGFARSLRELEASMTPQAVAARRAKREERWKTETRDPAALAKRLDAAERTDEVDYARQKERMTEPATRDPKSVWWGPRLALEAAQSRLASLDAAGQRAAACGRVDTAFLAHHAVRFELLAGASADCVAMVQVRRDLIDPKQPSSEVQLLTVWFGEILSGLPLTSGQPPQRGTCEQAVPLMRELDWAAVRKAIGW